MKERPNPKKVAANTPTILVVDDEIQVVAGIKIALRKAGFSVCTASSAREALQAFERRPIDVLVTDQDMPGMTGTELLAAVAEQSPQTFRIMLTGHARLEVALDAINSGGVDRFFTKPFDARLLAETVRDSLFIRSLTDRSRSLLRVARERQAQLDALEEQNPGITDIDLTETGAIEIEMSDGSPEDLLREIERETGGSVS